VDGVSAQKLCNPASVISDFDGCSRAFWWFIQNDTALCQSVTDSLNTLQSTTQITFASPKFTWFRTPATIKTTDLDTDFNAVSRPMLPEKQALLQQLVVDHLAKFVVKRESTEPVLKHLVIDLLKATISTPLIGLEYFMKDEKMSGRADCLVGFHTDKLTEHSTLTVEVKGVSEQVENWRAQLLGSVVYFAMRNQHSHFGVLTNLRQSQFVQVQRHAGSETAVTAKWSQIYEATINSPQSADVYGPLSCAQPTELNPLFEMLCEAMEKLQSNA
jgi:hypothetical protein